MYYGIIYAYLFETIEETTAIVPTQQLAFIHF
jgi:hypothetical protein